MPFTPVDNPRTFALTAELPLDRTTSNTAVANASMLFEAFKVTGYQHRDVAQRAAHSLGDFDVGSGAAICDCAGLVNWVVLGAAGDAYSELKQQLAIADEPGPRGYVRALASWIVDSHSSKCWQASQGVSGINSGSILAWMFPPEGTAQSVPRGHLCLALNRPVSVTGNPGEYRVPVFDSVQRPHGLSDTRWHDTRCQRGSVGKPSGVGIGQLHLLADDDGRISGIRWSDTAKPVTCNIYVGNFQ